MSRAKIIECGNGLPDVGDYVSVAGDLYEIVSMEKYIHTGQSGEGNYVYGDVEPADWSDVDDDNEPSCRAVIVAE